MKKYHQELSLQKEDNSEAESTDPLERRGEKEAFENLEEKIEWDGSEAELIADDAAEFEEKQTGIKLSYILRQNEIYECLKKSDVCKTTGTRAIAESVILGLASIFFTIFYILYHDPNTISFAVICLFLISVIWIVPQQGLKYRAKKLANGKEIKIKIYPDRIEIGKEEGRWEIALDGTTECAQISHMLVLYTPQTRMAILPLRCVDPAILPEVQATIISGTKPKEN